MLILSIDSSGMTASAALVTEEKILAEMNVNNKKTHSQTLLPMIAQLMDSVELEPEAIDLIAVAEGPGSFTGLRIGAGLAKGLGLTLDKPVIGISTIDAMAYAAGPGGYLVCPMIDARHETVYTGLYTWQFPDKGDKGTVLLSPSPGTESGAGMQTLIETQALTLQELAEQIAAIRLEADQIIISGDGAVAYRDRFEKYLDAAFEKAGTEPGNRPRVIMAPLHLQLQRAAALGALALERLDQAVSSDDFAPDYHRMTQAERMKKLKEQA